METAITKTSRNKKLVLGLLFIALLALGLIK
jgi:hypothetical protein